MNEAIETALANLSVPFAFMYYDGNADTYVTYQHTDSGGTLAGDNSILNCVDYYDFDVYSKTNFFPVIEELKTKLKAAGFLWQPSRSSADFYERDTKMYHKTICFAIERSV